MTDTGINKAKSLGGRGAVIALLAAVLIGWLWARSYRRGDAVFLFGPGGKAGGVVSVDGQVLVGATNVALGPGRAWTAQTVSTSVEEMRRLGESALDTAWKKRWGKFAAAAHVQDAFGVKGAWCRLVGVPHWLLVAPLLIPPMRWSTRRWVRARWRRAARCAECGYDLRGAAGQCPECGGSVAMAGGEGSVGRTEPRSPLKRALVPIAWALATVALLSRINAPAPAGDLPGESERLVARLYEVRDLAALDRQWTEFAKSSNTAPAASRPARPKSNICFFSTSAPTIEPTDEELLARTAIWDGSDFAPGAQATALKAHGWAGFLIVINTPEGHRRFEELLSILRSGDSASALRNVVSQVSQR